MENFQKAMFKKGNWNTEEQLKSSSKLTRVCDFNSDDVGSTLLQKPFLQGQDFPPQTRGGVIFSQRQGDARTA